MSCFEGKTVWADCAVAIVASCGVLSLGASVASEVPILVVE